MKTNTFEDKLYALADDFSNIEINARFHNADWLVYAITDLVLNDVIGQDGENRSRNALRAEQRAIIKGGN